METELVNGNRMLAKFMRADEYHKDEFKINEQFYHPREMEYRTSMDWLWPVVRRVMDQPDVLSLTIHLSERGFVSVVIQPKDKQLPTIEAEGRGLQEHFIYDAIIKYLQTFNKIQP